MTCDKVNECEVLKLIQDFGLVRKEIFELSDASNEKVYNTFAGIEPLVLVRDSSDCGLGRLYFRSVFICDTLENPDYMMPLGLYNMVNTYSSKFKRFLPEIKVPNHVGIRIHQANYMNDLKGCVAVGIRPKEGIYVNSSLATLERLLYVINYHNINYFRFS